MTTIKMNDINIIKRIHENENGWHNLTISGVILKSGTK